MAQFRYQRLAGVHHPRTEKGIVGRSRQLWLSIALLAAWTITPKAISRPNCSFDAAELAERYEELRPKTAVSLVTIGCPQASVGELRATAELLGKGNSRSGYPDAPPLWIFTSSAK